MNTEIPYLKKLETDLTRAAAAAAETRGGGRRRRPTSGAWLRWSGAAAAILVLAWGIGSLSSNGGIFPTSGSATSAADGAADQPGRERIPEVASASPAPVSGALGGLERELFGNSDAASAATWQAAGDTDEQRTGPGYSETATTTARIDLAKIDRDGSVTLKITEGTLGDTFIAVIDIAEGAGGMLLSSETVGDGAAHLVLRIPAARFDRAFAQVSQLGEVRASTITGKDVTADYIDYQAQLRILKSRREVIFGLYDQVTGISQTLQLENELNRVQLEIDRIQGQLNYLDAQTSISTLKVSLTETEPDVEQLVEGDDRPSLGQAFDSGLDGFLGVVSAMIVGLGYLIPVAVLLGIAALIVMLVRRRDRGAS